MFSTHISDNTDFSSATAITEPRRLIAEKCLDIIEENDRLRFSRANLAITSLDTDRVLYNN